jgi:hypothetical protein
MWANELASQSALRAFPSSVRAVLSTTDSGPAPGSEAFEGSRSATDWS